MKTSARSKRSLEQGATLLEILIALTIISLATGLVGANVSTRAQELVVDRAADALVLDLKRARLAAQTSGEPIVISADAGGYLIPALSINRAFPTGLAARWNGDEEFLFLIGTGLEQKGATIRLSNGKSGSRVLVAPVTGRISRER
jgi:type II secretory pathway pseudopilin PulG